MQLYAQVNGIEPKFQCDIVSFCRKHGESAKVTVTFHLREDDYKFIPQLADKILSGKSEMQVLAGETNLFTQIKNILISAVHNTGKGENEIALSGFLTNLGAEPYLPVRRVLKAAHLHELLEHFKATIFFNNSVGDYLKTLKFPDDKKTNHIQDGLTDFEMLSSIVKWHNHSVKPEDALLITGDVADKRFKLVWAQDSKYRKQGFNTSKERSIDPKDPNNAATIQFGRSANSSLHLMEGLHHAGYVSYHIRHGNFDAKFWTNWAIKNLPLYYKEHFAYEIIDTLQSAGEFIDWKSWIHVLPKNELLHVSDRLSLNPWFSTGIVSKRDQKSEWMEVTLPEFEKDDNVLDVRISTPYSGKKQTGGLHLVPEEGSEVLVMKSNNWMSPAILLGNIRNKQASVNAPFWQLEDPATWDFREMEMSVKKMDSKATENFTFKSKKHEINGTDEIEIHTSGVKAKFDNKNMNIS